MASGQMKVNVMVIGERVWICGRMFDDGKPWEILGVYLDEPQAVARCRQWYDFVGPMPLGVDLPEETTGWVGAYYPPWGDDRHVPEPMPTTPPTSIAPQGPGTADAKGEPSRKPEDASAPTYGYGAPQRYSGECKWKFTDKIARERHGPTLADCAAKFETHSIPAQPSALDKLREIAESEGGVGVRAFDANTWSAHSTDVDGCVRWSITADTLERAIEGLAANVDAPPPAPESIEQRIERIASKNGPVYVDFNGFNRWRVRLGDTEFTSTTAIDEALDALEAEIKRRAGK